MNGKLITKQKIIALQYFANDKPEGGWFYDYVIFETFLFSQLLSIWVWDMLGVLF